jgi:DNA-binding NarL/FixJ family response regulator
MRGLAIVEDHQLLAETLAATLRRRGLEAEIIELSEPADLLAELLERRPRLVVLDLDLGAFGDSTWLIAPLVSDGIQVIVLTGSDNRLRIASALEQGALGYQLKTAGFNSLVDLIEHAMSCGTGILDVEARTQLLDELSEARIANARRLERFARLTDRERDTLQQLARGRTVHEIAASWVLSEATVRTHVRSVLAKLNVPSQLAAVSFALRSGWLDSAARLTGSNMPESSRRSTDVFAADQPPFAPLTPQSGFTLS